MHKLMLGTALVAGAIVLSPYVLPALGLGGGDLALEALTALHGTGLGTGLAGAINTGLNAAPLIGPALAQGGLASAAASGGIGIGGVLLGRFLEKRQDGKEGVNWGKVIKYGALLSSALIALPSVLTGISTGIVYLAAVFSGVQLASAAVTFLGKTLGAMGGAHLGAAGLAGAASALPHLLTCGAALFPAMFSARLASESAPPPGSASTGRRSPAADTSPVRVDVAMASPTSANIPAKGQLRLTDIRTGLPLTDDELAVTYTRKLHLYVADQSLKDYHHIHPEPTGLPGVFAFSFTPRTSNRYSAWTDFTLLKDGVNHRLKADLPAVSRRNIPAVIRTASQAQIDGLSFEWQGEPLREGLSSFVNVKVTDARGNPVTDLEPVMGAYAHLVGFSADGRHFIHTHPLGEEPAGPNERGGPVLRFHIEPDNSGPTQFYLQVRRGGTDIYVPFGKEIGTRQHPQRLSTALHGLGHHPAGLSPG